MGLSNAERQRRHRERLKAGQPLSRVRYRAPKDRRSKAQRWSDAVQELVDLQAVRPGSTAFRKTSSLRQWQSGWRLSATWMWTPYRISSRREGLAVIEPEAFSREAGLERE